MTRSAGTLQSLLEKEDFDDVNGVVHALVTSPPVREATTWNPSTTPTPSVRPEGGTIPCVFRPSLQRPPINTPTVSLDFDNDS